MTNLNIGDTVTRKSNKQDMGWVERCNATFINPNNIMTVVNILDNDMVELEGLGGAWVPECFNVVTKDMLEESLYNQRCERWHVIQEQMYALKQEADTLFELIRKDKE